MVPCWCAGAEAIEHCWCGFIVGVLLGGLLRVLVHGAWACGNYRGFGLLSIRASPHPLLDKPSTWMEATILVSSRFRQLFTLSQIAEFDSQLTPASLIFVQPTTQSTAPREHQQKRLDSIACLTNNRVPHRHTNRPLHQHTTTSPH